MKTDLHVAVIEDQIDLVVDLISKGYDVNEKDSDGCTPLHVAGSKNLQITKLLIEAGSNVNEKNNNGYIPLHFSLNSVEVTKLLLKAGADPNVEDASEKVLHISVLTENTDLTKLLLDAGVDVNDRDKDNKTALYYAVLMKNLEIVKLLVKASADVNAGDVDEDLYTPIELAILSKNIRMLELFVNLGVDFNSKNEKGDTPMRYAVECENFDIVKMMVEAGADVNARGTDDFFTPLEMAISLRNYDIVKLFMGYNPKLSQKDRNDDTPLHLAAELGNSKIVNLLLDADASTSEKNKDEDFPLNKAIQSQNINSVKVLIDAGADINALDIADSTPLHCAAESGNLSIVKFILELSADVNVGDFSGYTPLHTAAFHLVHERIFKFFIKNGANVNECDDEGDTVSRVLVEKFKYEKLESTESKERAKKVLKLLLEYTNVNLMYNGKNVLSETFKSLRSHLQQEFFSKIILQHVAKLKSLNFIVDPNLLNTIASFDDCNEYFTKCGKELEKAKTTKLRNSWVTFFNLLIDDKSKFVKYAGNEDLIEDFKNTNLKENFPIYGDTMQKNVLKGVRARDVFDKTADKLSNFLRIFNPTHLIIRDILDVLSKKDWYNLCEKKRLRE